MKYPITILRHIPLHKQEEILIGMIENNLDYFIQLTDDVNLTKHKKKTYQVSELIFKYLLAQTSSESQTIKRYSQLFREQLCPHTAILDSILKTLDEKFIEFIDYHFNYRTLSILEMDIDYGNLEHINQICEVMQEHIHEKYPEFVNRSLTTIESKEYSYLSFVFSNHKITIIERIGYYRLGGSEREQFSSFLVKYVIDLQNGFLEYHWNKTATQNFYKNKIPQDIMLNNEDELTGYMQSKINEWFDDGITTSKSVPDIISPLEDHHSAQSAFQTSPLEASLYHLFIEDHENLLQQINEVFPSNTVLSKNPELNSYLQNNYDLSGDSLEKAISLLNGIRLRDLVKEIDSLQLSQYIYSFALRDIVNVTSSRTRHSRREPVYHTEPYWYLLEMIKRLKVVSEISFHYEIDEHEDIRYQQKFTVKVRRDKLTFEFLQSSSENDANINYLAESRRSIYEHIKNRIREFIRGLSQVTS
ncbi:MULTISPECIES: hypothetical protein [unclassified Exiguobacterium]|uniref:hypothetical protein n=1 Tax=unclassified Exiguobacterium TaxID=2644629 RepID=UPI001BEC0CBC|nr:MULTISPECIES: hypothetical protein [unclassified Exiguobacterium]